MAKVPKFEEFYLMFWEICCDIPKQINVNSCTYIVTENSFHINSIHLFVCAYL